MENLLQLCLGDKPPWVYIALIVIYSHSSGGSTKEEK